MPPEMTIKYFIAKWNVYETKTQKVSFAREMERDLKNLIKNETENKNYEKMKAEIHITGQIGGNFKLLRSLSNYTKKEDGMFNSFYLYYDTIGEAKKDMRQAWKRIKSEDDSLTQFDRLTKDLETLNYDASVARICKPYKN